MCLIRVTRIDGPGLVTMDHARQLLHTKTVEDIPSVYLPMSAPRWKIFAHLIGPDDCGPTTIKLYCFEKPLPIREIGNNLLVPIETQVRPRDEWRRMANSGERKKKKKRKDVGRPKGNELSKHGSDRIRETEIFSFNGWIGVGGGECMSVEGNKVHPSSESSAGFKYNQTYDWLSAKLNHVLGAI